MTTVMPTHARTGMARSRYRVTFGVLSATLGLSMLTPAPAGAATLPPTHLVGAGTSASVDDTAYPDALPATGTVAAVVAAPERVTSTEVLHGGDNGVAVRRIQRILGVPVTGFFGPATRDAVIRFQEALGADRGTGIVGPITSRQLQTFGEQQAKKAVRAAARAEVAKKAAAAAAAARIAAAQKATRDTSRPAPPTSTGSSNGGDPTMTSAARGSRSAREAVPFSVWRSSAHARMIVARESGGRCTAVNPNGLYRGTWQMGTSFWRAFGGLQFAATPDRATCGEQDYVAYRGWLASWWSPWGG
jgi:peptidoglycan hydrolase-like protein with peptidoglycan-binding domain